MTTYTDANHRPLWILAGASKCRAYHLTPDDRAGQFVGDATDGTEVAFLSLCGKQVTETCVIPSVNNPETVCKACSRRATAV